MSPTFQLLDCPIFLGSLAGSFPKWLAQQDYSQVFVIADTNTAALCFPLFLEKTGLKPHPELTVIPAGEANKNLHSCEKIWQAMLAANLDRKALVLNLGGGVIGDIGGFCAATWKRGMDYVHIPTTLLAMTDAAIGGKLGIDFQGVKNIIGVFRQPAAVFIDPEFLNTLPAREMRSGYAELIKHAQLSGSFKLPESLPEQSSKFPESLHDSIAVKVHIVSQDPHEKGLRMLLNFGHSIGHALESYFLETEAPLTHGEAVAIGMICEMELFRRRDALVELISRAFPHRHIPEAAFPAIWGMMQQDKKNSSGKVRIALPDELPFSMKIVAPTQADVARSLLYYNRLGTRSK